MANVPFDRGALKVGQVMLIMTLPTAVILDSSGRTTAVNAGFAPDPVLRDQVLAARAASAQPVMV